MICFSCKQMVRNTAYVYNTSVFLRNIATVDSTMCSPSTGEFSPGRSFMVEHVQVIYDTKAELSTRAALVCKVGISQVHEHMYCPDAALLQV